jgi:VanZ family protein
LEHNKLLLALAIGWTATVAYFCLLSSNELPSIALGMDKVGHIAFHFGITLSWFLYFKSRKSNMGYKSALIKAFLFSFCFGIVIEFCQAFFTTTRQADIKDVFANIFGALLAVSVVLLTKKFLKPKK